MKKVMLLLGLSLGLTFSAQSQTATYQTLTDDPGAMPNLTVKLMPAQFEVFTGKKNKRENINDNQNGMNAQALINVGFDVQLDPLPGDLPLGVDLKFRRSLVEIYETKVDSDFVRYNHLELGGSWTLRRKDLTQKRNLKIDEGLTTVTSLTNVPMTVRRETKLRGGIFRTRLPASFDFALYTHASVARTTGIYAGFKFTESLNYAARVNDFGTAKDSYRISFYGDVMFAPKVSFEDVIYDPFGAATIDTFDATHFSDSLNLGRNLGFRLGFEYELRASEMIGFNAQFDLGYQPPLNGWHIYFGGGITVNLNAGRKEEE